MCKVLDKDMIENEMVAYIPGTTRGFPPKVPLYEIVNVFLYKLKTRDQWDRLPVKALFERGLLVGSPFTTTFRNGAGQGSGRTVG